MPLDPTSLAHALEDRWLGGSGDDWSASVFESAGRFAEAVSGWFAGAVAGGLPCATALARRSQLEAAAAAALQAGSASAAGQQLGAAIAGYMAGQVFGPGVASFPAAAAAGSAGISAAFSDLASTNATCARRIADACHATAVSTVVVFPPPMPPGPVV